MGEIVFIENDRVVTDSLMVAEVFGKDHDKVIRDIKGQISKLNEAGEEIFSTANFGESEYRSERGRTYKKYLLTEDAFTIVTMSYVTVEAMKFKVKFIKEFNRMRQMLGSNNSNLPSSFAEALRLAADLEEEKEKLQKENQELLPKAKSFETFIDGSNYQKMNDVAKSLGYGRNKLFELLRQEKILMRDNLPYQRYIESGYFIVKESPVTRGNFNKNVSQTYVTSKGVDFISKILDKNKVLRMV